MFDHKELETLVAIVDGQSFDHAARQLNVSAGAVSQRIKSLENRIGSAVLIRSTPPKPTTTGLQVLSYARRLLLIHNEMDIALHHHAQEGTLPLTIAVNHDSLSCWFLEVINRLKDNTHLSFDVRTSNTVDTQKQLTNGDVVAAITSCNSQVAGCKTRYLGKLEYVAVCSRSFYQRYFNSSMAKAQYSKAPVVVYDRDDHLIERYLASRNIDAQPEKTHYIPSSHVLMDAAIKGLGWTMLPRGLLNKHSSSLVVMEESPLYVDLYWNTWDQVSDIIADVENVLLSVAAEKLLA